MDQTACKQLERQIKIKIDELYQRLLSSQQFKQLSDKEQNHSYIVLRIEQMVRDTIGTERNRTLNRIMEENSELKQDIQRWKNVYEQSQQQCQSWRTKAQELQLDCDRLKFEVISCGRLAEDSANKMNSEMKETKEALRISESKVQRINIELERVSKALADKIREVQQLQQIRSMKSEAVSPISSSRYSRESGVGALEEQVLNMRQQIKNLQQQIHQQKKINQILEANNDRERLNNDQAANEREHVTEQYKLKQQYYLAQIEKLESQLNTQRQKTNTELEAMRKQYEVLKSHTVDSPRLALASKERDILKDEIKSLTVQLEECRKSMRGQDKRLEDMDNEMISLNRTIHRQQQQMEEWQQRLQKKTQEMEGLDQQKEKNQKKITQIDRLNKDLKAMYQKKIEVITQNHKEEVEKMSRYRMELKAGRDEIREVRAKKEKYEAETRLLEQQLIKSNKVKQDLEKQLKSIKSENKNHQKICQHRQSRVQILQVQRKHQDIKLINMKNNLKQLMKKVKNFNGSLDDCRFKILQQKNFMKLFLDRLVLEISSQIVSKTAINIKQLTQQNNYLNEQLSLTRYQLKNQQQKQLQYLKQIEILEEKVDKRVRDSEAIVDLERQLSDLQRLCAKLQQTNCDNLREIEYLQKVRHEEQLQRQLKNTESEVTIMGQVGKDKYSHETQRHYDKIIKTLQDENIKLKSETSRAQKMFEKELAKLNDLYRGRQRYNDQVYSLQQIPRKGKSSRKDLLEPDLCRTREKISHGSLFNDIKKDIQQQKKKIQQNRKAILHYGEM